MSKITRKKRALLHSIVAKLLFVANRARPDIIVPISFLTSRVTIADEDDWKKLKRLLCYINNTIDMPLTLSIDNINVLKTWVDASYATHDDMKSHTGGAIMMGLGTLYSKSTKQKLNTKSSTEAELVGASDFLSQTIWTKNFIEAQGFTIERNEFFQDNMSAMKLEQNGRISVGQKSRHINIRYFFIKDRIAEGDIVLIHCPTEIMIADFFTKPLQGSLFIKFRDIIMGITHYSTLNSLPLSLSDNRSVLEYDNIRTIIDSTNMTSYEKNVTNNIGATKASTINTTKPKSILRTGKYVTNDNKENDKRTFHTGTDHTEKGISNKNTMKLVNIKDTKYPLLMHTNLYHDSCNKPNFDNCTNISTNVTWRPQLEFVC